MAIPIIDGEGYMKERMHVEYEWKPPCCSDCHVFGHAFEQCPRHIKEMPKPTEEVHNDGFKTVVNRKSKGKAIANSQKRTFGGVKVTNPKNNFIYQPVKPKEVTPKPATKETSNKPIIETSNPFYSLRDQEDSTSEAVVGESSGGNEGYDIFGNPNQSVVLNKVDLDSEVEETLIVEGPAGSKTKGASTPSKDLSVCAILESHVDLSALSQVCSKVFKYREWTSNANLCTKGCRVILGWNVDVVNVVVISQTDQAMHVKVIHKVSTKIMFCSFIYAGNLISERRLLWAELGLHKLMVRGYPWTLLGDFNVALNFKDTFSGSSFLSSDMIEFKDCVADIEVMDINCSSKFLDVVAAHWNVNISGHHIYQLTSKLKALKKPLRKLVYDHGNKLRHELDEAQKALDL
ncbi:reverse transcriptase domain-containing protein [Tanacetum coccineum]